MMKNNLKNLIKARNALNTKIAAAKTSGICKGMLVSLKEGRDDLLVCGMDNYGGNGARIKFRVLARHGNKVKVYDTEGWNTPRTFTVDITRVYNPRAAK